MPAKIFVDGNYLFLETDNFSSSDTRSEVKIYLNEDNKYVVTSELIGTHEFDLSELVNESNVPYDLTSWNSFYRNNSGFNAAPGGSGAANNLGTFSNYDSLILSFPNTTFGNRATTLNSQGTPYLPFSLGGTYRPAGSWVFDGVNWVSNNKDLSKAIQDILDDRVDNITNPLAGQYISTIGLSNILWESYIYSDDGLVNQTVGFEPFFIRGGVLNNVTNGVWNISIPENGDYELFIYYRYSINTTTSDFLCHILRDGSVFDFPLHIESKDAGGPGLILPTVAGGVLGGNVNTGTNQFLLASGKKVLTNLISGQNISLELEFANQVANSESTILEAFMGLRRIINRNV